MKLFLMFFAIALFAFNSFAQEVETAEPQQQRVAEKLLSEEILERLAENMRSRYSQKNIQTLLFRKRELEKQLRSPKLPAQTRQRLNLEHTIIQERINELELN